MRLAFFITCLTDQFYPRAGLACCAVLKHLGHDVIFPQAQTCCGQPMYNAGYHDQARDLARYTLNVFEEFEHVVTPSGSCCAMLREHYASLFESDLAMAARAEQCAVWCPAMRPRLCLRSRQPRAAGASGPYRLWR